MALQPTVTDMDILIRALSGTLFGTLIGAERQYRARNAGLRTNALVSTGATLFVLLSARGFVSDYGTPDPTRVAAQIVSGIGFLGAGVIMRDGFNVRGINTAATLWCSAAVGALAGAGLLKIGALGTAIVLLVNIVLRKISRLLSKIPNNGDEHPANYVLTVKVLGQNDTENREFLMRALKSTHYYLQAMETSSDGDETLYRVWLSTEDKDDKVFEGAIRELSLNPAFISIHWVEENEKVYDESFSRRLIRRNFRSSSRNKDGEKNIPSPGKATSFFENQ